MASTTIVDHYSTGKDNNIQLKITIQSNQKAKSSVRIEDTPVGSGSFDIHLKLHLAKAKNLPETHCMLIQQKPTSIPMPTLSVLP